MSSSNSQSIASDSNVAVVIGAQWGDEGKGKLVDILAADYDLCARYNGGSNAGHTIVRNGKKFAVHLLPSGLLHDNAINYIGNGVVLNVPKLFSELEALEKAGIDWKGRLFISDRAQLVFPFHQKVDGANEDDRGAAKLGTTRQGIGPTYSQKAERRGIRVHHIFEPQVFSAALPRAIKGWEKRFGDLEVDQSALIKQYTGEYADLLRPMVVNGPYWLHDQLSPGSASINPDPSAKPKSLLIESANATMLDIDHGTYPFVTSSNPTLGGALTGLGLNASHFRSAKIVGIVKAYTTRVGEGPFPTELSFEHGIGKHLKDVGHEYGTTTGRPRRCGWLDLVMVRYAHVLNGFTSLNLTKLDVLDQLDEIKVAVSYNLDNKPMPRWPASLETLAKVQPQYVTLPGWKTDISKIRTYQDLPENARNYVEFIEKQLNIFIEYIGVGPGDDAMIHRKRNSKL
mmetsp:Transcript_14771/g.22061  ORF Transcript_14771/g.22061 Transcript_14771/m.22061 type:complete len:456 (+) Transcript_14771:70-1437(+)|eukprot:CAMPEP_0201547488 /NCGR_PEP_ID=MMETSP0173_2-20130828/3954_1 /ASSEMBLY_ACC=CAM_ASM_000268 /TAXON_ID=218659 /ORGANISM="Vexillifera sp., Strain DIVA3 564/2" /LENGTH=455 /DNA_ID=CAMNT_0047956549 /DNA_START=70 /DNA_END=1437 /DNA_ORIENTATION=-